MLPTFTLCHLGYARVLSLTIRCNLRHLFQSIVYAEVSLMHPISRYKHLVLSRYHLIGLFHVGRLFIPFHAELSYVLDTTYYSLFLGALHRHRKQNEQNSVATPDSIFICLLFLFVLKPIAVLSMYSVFRWSFYDAAIKFLITVMPLL